jgi:hypothetical protein
MKPETEDKVGCILIVLFFAISMLISLFILTGEIARAFVWLKWAFS